MGDLCWGAFVKDGEGVHPINRRVRHRGTRMRLANSVASLIEGENFCHAGGTLNHNARVFVKSPIGNRSLTRSPLPFLTRSRILTLFSFFLLFFSLLLFLVNEVFY